MVHLKIKVVSGSTLNAADSNGKSDPYLTLACGGAKAKTKTIEKTLNPEWNEELNMNIPKGNSTGALNIEVFDYDGSGADDSLGKGTIELSGLVMGQEQSFTVSLKGGDVGENVVGMVQAQALSSVKGLFSKKKKAKPKNGMQAASNKGKVTLLLTAVDFGCTSA